MFIQSTLPVVPKPYHDELISSWIYRIASLYGLLPGELLERIQWTGDSVDYRPQREDINRLSRITNTPAERIRGMSLAFRYPNYWHGDLFCEDQHSKIFPKYCPRCFRDDIAKGNQPYFRHQWASLWKVQCYTHGTPLLDWEKDMTRIYRLLMDGGAKANIYRELPISKKQRLLLNNIFGDKSAKHVDSNFYECDSRNYLHSVNDHLLTEFETAVDNSMRGINPGPNWWLGSDANLFIKVVREIMPILLMRWRTRYYVHIPAQRILKYQGINVKLLVPKGQIKYHSDLFHKIPEFERHVTLMALSRLMVNPNKICLSKNYFCLNEPVEDVFELLFDSVSVVCKQLIYNMSKYWSDEGHDRIKIQLKGVMFPRSREEVDYVINYQV